MKNNEKKTIKIIAATLALIISLAGTVFISAGCGKDGGETESREETKTVESGSTAETEQGETEKQGETEQTEDTENNGGAEGGEELPTEELTQEEQYDKAVEAVDSGDYETAYKSFKTVGDFKDSESYLKHILAVPGEIKVTDGFGYTYTYKFEYDKNGYVLSSKYTDSDGVEHNGFTNKFTYDGNGNVVKEEYKATGSSDTVVYEYTYDDSGNKTHSSCAEDDGSTTTGVFAYDGNGYLSAISYNNGDSAYSYNYTYDGDRLSEYSVISGGNTFIKNEFKYNSDGVLTESVYTGDGDTATTVYTYGKDGSIISETTTDGSGNTVKYELSDYKYFYYKDMSMLENYREFVFLEW